MSPRKGWASALLRVLLPSIVAESLWRDQKPNYRIHPTSYLDGLRGLASFVVAICHYTESNHGYFVPTYGLNGDKPSSFIQLPYFRIIYSGRPMVHIFFVISGFVLSYKPLKCIHAGQIDKCNSVLGSSTFRRPIRLFLPCVASTVIIAMLMQMGYIYKAEPSMGAAINAWVWGVFHKVTWPWDWDHEVGPPYDIHLWTIPIEFNHSMLLFLMIMCLSRLRLFTRLFGVIGIMIYGMACGRWATFEFFGGMLLAELHVLQSIRSEAYSFLEEKVWAQQLLRPKMRTFFAVLAMLIGWYIGGWPNSHAEDTWGIAWMNRMTPTPFLGGDMPQRFWFAIGAVMIVWASGELAWVKRFLEGGLAQYCGRLSFAIYIVHGPALEMWQGHVVGLPWVPGVGNPGEEGYRAPVKGFAIKGIFGHDTPIQQLIVWFLGIVVLGLPIVWASDLFWRYIDIPVVNFGRWLENLCLDPGPESKDRDGYALAQMA
jgi:peptidoglycan/LPS O-acetylase OafA/YrhL